MPDLDEEGANSITRQQRAATLVFGAGLLGLGLFWSWEATKIQTRNTYQAITPDFLPFWAGLGLAAAGFFVLVSAWQQHPLDEDPNDPTFDLRGQLRVWAAFGALLVYTLLLEQIHYFFLTLAMMAITLLIARERLGLWLAVKSLLSAVLMYLIFIRAFGVPLPGSVYF
jgi:hypothetical protein